MDCTTILAIDLGKFNSVLCCYEPQTRIAAFGTIRTDDAELRAELLQQPIGLVVFETCSHLARAPGPRPNRSVVA